MKTKRVFNTFNSIDEGLKRSIRTVYVCWHAIHTGGGRCEWPECTTDTFRTWYLSSKSNAISWSVNSLSPLSQEISSLRVQVSLIPITMPSPAKAAQNSILLLKNSFEPGIQPPPKTVMIFCRKRIRSSRDRSLVRSARPQVPVKREMLPLQRHCKRGKQVCQKEKLGKRPSASFARSSSLLVDDFSF